MKVVLCAGGTGGHILPAIVLASLMNKKNWNIKIMCRSKDVNLSEKFQSFSKDLVFLPGRGLPRNRISIKFFLFILDLLVAFFKSFFFLLSYKPDLLISFGGYISFAPSFAAFLCRIPVIMVEQNSIPGLANKMISLFCKEIFLNFEEAKKYFNKGTVINQPVDPSIGTVSRKSGCLALGLNPKRKTILILGGSQGAQGLNNIVKDTVKNLSDWNIIWSCGRNNLREISSNFGPKDADRVAVAGFFENMSEVYAAADVVVCRAGASTLSELDVCGLSAVLVPFPYATDDHQFYNALSFAKKHNAIVIREEELDPKKLMSAVLTLIKKNPLRKKNISADQINEKFLEKIESIIKQKGT